MSVDVYLVDEHNEDGDYLFSRGYTHNVVPMWKLIGVYDVLYLATNDGEKEVRAEEIVSDLATGLKTMLERFAECEALNPSNGWGDALGALNFLYEWTKACALHPKAKVHISR